MDLRKTVRVRFLQIWVGFYVIAAVASTSTALATPQFARETNLPCASCHMHVPLLNKFGQQFYSNGFRLPKDHRLRATTPLWVGLAAEGSASPDTGSAVPVAYDDTTLSSVGSLGQSGILYHFEYAPIPKDVELNATRAFGRGFAIQVGKFGMISQFDSGLEISPSSPIFLGPSDNALNEPSARVGPFALDGNNLGIRTTFALGNALQYGDGWKIAATIPFTNEIAGDSGGGGPLYAFGSDPKGLLVEAFRRTGMDSVGLDSFAGKDGRHFYGVAAQHVSGPVYFLAGAGYAAGYGDETRTLSLSADWIPAFDKALGFRVDCQDGVLSYVPMASYIIGGRESALELTLESSFSAGVSPSSAFTAAYRF